MNCINNNYGFQEKEMGGLERHVYNIEALVSITQDME
jgi:hypothetical protein